jgi:hypothetical protein
MGLIKKIFLASGISLCVVVMLISGTGVYLYYHPDLVKPICERSLSASTGASCTVEKLSYSLKPMVLDAYGTNISLSFAGAPQGGKAFSGNL